MGFRLGHYRWKAISDLPGDLDSLRDRELESLREVWVKEKERRSEKAVTAFVSELKREWAIETGIIEGVYTLDRGITQTLIERGIDSSYIPHDATNRDPELVARIIRTHADVLDGLFSFITGERALTVGYIKEIHSALLRNQDTVVVFDQLGRSLEKPPERGAYKRMPNNPTRADGAIHEYCPPEHVASEMELLIQMYRQHEDRGVGPHIEAAWIHHAFTQIHPFEDGNGRVARALASLIFIKGGYFPLVVNRDDRERYIDALESADEGDLSRLTQLFAQLQKRALTRAISRAMDVIPARSLDEALAATRDVVLGVAGAIPAEYLNAKRLAITLRDNAVTKFDNVATKLGEDIRLVDPSFEFRAEMTHAPHSCIQSVAEKLNYDPNLNGFNEGAAIIFKAKGVYSSIVVSFHSVGAAFRGLLVAVSYFQTADAAAIPLSQDVFRINYRDSQVEIVPRFDKWLDGCLIEGIAQWRRTLV